MGFDLNLDQMANTKPSMPPWQTLLLFHGQYLRILNTVP